MIFWKFLNIHSLKIHVFFNISSRYPHQHMKNILQVATSAHLLSLEKPFHVIFPIAVILHLNTLLITESFLLPSHLNMY